MKEPFVSVKSSGGRVGRYGDEEEYIDDGGDSDSSLVQEFSAEWDRIKMSNYGQSTSTTTTSSLLHADSGFESGSPVGQTDPLQSAVGGVYENAVREGGVRHNHNQRDNSGKYQATTK